MKTKSGPRLIGVRTFIHKLRKIALAMAVRSETGPTLIRILRAQSKSQLGQDLFALAHSPRKTGGYFVEFGAVDGVSNSNTHFLEKQYDWNGIVAEPVSKWHAALRQNRRCHIETSCVWRESGEKLTFIETANLELSTLEVVKDGDRYDRTAQKNESYEVTTISLLDLLKKHRAPKVIDYLSLDTEGSEYDILSAFDFKTYEIHAITVEHNYAPVREKIHELLTKNDYERVMTSWSKFDDWYVRRGI